MINFPANTPSFTMRYEPEDTQNSHDILAKTRISGTGCCYLLYKVGPVLRPVFLYNLFVFSKLDICRINCEMTDFFFTSTKVVLSFVRYDRPTCKESGVDEYAMMIFTM